MLRSRQFFPLWLASILGAMNDNLARAAIIVLAIQILPPAQAASAALLATALLMAPFFLFSGIAGHLADTREKSGLLRLFKISEVAIATGVAAFLVLGLPIYWAFGLIFLMGAQSAFFGPLKQGWLPERMPTDDLVHANAWLDASTQLAIVAGTALGGLLVALFSPVAAGIGCLLLALAGLAAAFMAPKGPAGKTDRQRLSHPLRANFTLARDVLRAPGTRALVGLQMWFWGAGAVVLSLLPAVVDQALAANGQAATPVMALFSVGIALGAAIIAKTLGRSHALWTTPLAALGMAIGASVIWWGASNLTPVASLRAIATDGPALILAAGVLLLSMAAGAFVVPLHAALQRTLEPQTRARHLAGFNVLTASAAVAGTLLCMGLVSLGLSSLHILALLALAATAIFVCVLCVMPRESLKGLFRSVFFPLFRVEVVGAQHLDTQGPVVFVANHTSLLDGPLLFGLIDRPTAFAVDTGWAQGRILRRFKKVLSISPIDPQRPLSAKSLAKTIAQGHACAIFPEGRISVTGAPMKINPGAAWLIDNGHAQIVSIHIEGLERSKQSKAGTGWKRIWLPKVRVHVSPPQRLELDADLRGKARREAAVRRLKTIMEDTRFHGLFRHQHLPEAIAEAARTHGTSHVAYCDIEGLQLTRGKIALGAAVLARILPKWLGERPNVGVLLPAAPGAAVVLTALWKMNKAPALLNPTVGPQSLLKAMKAAGADTVLTSKAFVEKGKFDALVAHIEKEGIEIVYTEDVRAGISLRDKMGAFFQRHRVARDLGPDSIAAILFTSGTEGDPKGVALTHTNLLANVAQLRARTDIGPNDVSLCALPLFHSFGLTAGMVLPLLAGIKTGLHPSPLHYRLIPLFAGILRPTIMFGTDTFLQGWARRATPEDFASLRAAVAGAEPLKDSTRALWAQRFGVRLLEGYGATECGPVLSLTTPAEPFAQTVGRLLPGMTARLESLPGVDGKRLFVKGPNVMAGYLKTARPGHIERVEDGWYDTGDAVRIDENGCIRIVGRVKRFAKVGGEMVSLAGVEELGARVWPDASVAAIAVPDERTGEQVLLFTTHPEATKAQVQAVAKQDGIGAILVPGKVIVRDSIPLLASGKTDYPALTRAWTQS